MKCPKCGRENIPGTPFCADCGKNLFAQDAEAAPAAADAPSAAASEAAPDSPTLTISQTIVEEFTPAQPPMSERKTPEPESSTPIFSDGAIYIAPLMDEDAEPAPEPEPTSEPEPIPDPEPAAEFEAAFDEPASSEAQAVTEEAPATKVPAAPVPAAPVPAAPKPTPPAPAPAPAPEAAAEPEAPAAPTGTPVVPAAQPDAAASDSTPPAAEEPQFAPFANASAPIVPPNPARAHTTYAQPAGEALYKKGCLAAAWDDILQTQGWLGKILLLGLVYCVPILNFFVLGYAMRWSRELFLGKVSPMPKRIFGNRMFVNGFFAFVLELVVGIVAGICGVILEFIPFIGAIAYMALVLFVSAFEYLALLRIAIADRLGAGFDISQIWQTGKRNFAALCCATIVPVLIIEAIMFVICFAVGLIMGIPLMGTISELASASTYSYYYSDAEIFALAMQMLAVLLPMMLVIYIIACFLGAFMTVLVMRATGHYVARYAQSWSNEQAVMSTAHINDQPE